VLAKVILVSVGYADVLEITLPRVKSHFSQICVVTSPWDDDTSKVVSRYKGVKLYVTDVFYEGGAIFNKGAAIEEAFDVVGRDGWIVVMDPDIYLPRVVNWNRLRLGCIHGVQRHEVQEWKNKDLDDQFSKAPIVREVIGAGYFQIFHAMDSRICNRRPWYGVNWKHAGGCDSDLLELWPCSRRIDLGWRVLHLGKVWENWLGRESLRGLEYVHRLRSMNRGFVPEKIDSGWVSESIRKRGERLREDFSGEKIEVELPRGIQWGSNIYVVGRKRVGYCDIVPVVESVGGRVVDRVDQVCDSSLVIVRDVDACSLDLKSLGGCKDLVRLLEIRDLSIPPQELYRVCKEYKPHLYLCYNHCHYTWNRYSWIPLDRLHRLLPCVRGGIEFTSGSDTGVVLVTFDEEEVCEIQGLPLGVIRGTDLDLVDGGSIECAGDVVVCMGVWSAKSLQCIVKLLALGKIVISDMPEDDVLPVIYHDIIRWDRRETIGDMVNRVRREVTPTRVERYKNLVNRVYTPQYIAMGILDFVGNLIK